jgi:hypothetical protein
MDSTKLVEVNRAKGNVWNRMPTLRRKHVRGSLTKTNACGLRIRRSEVVSKKHPVAGETMALREEPSVPNGGHRI